MAVQAPAAERERSDVWYVEGLVERARQQDQAAFSDLYERYAPRIHGYLSRRLGARADEAEDLTADVFAKMVEKLDTYEFRRLPFSAWLFRIARNHLIDHARVSGRRQPALSLDQSPLLGGTTRLPFAQNVTTDQIREALRQLTEEQRQVVLLRFIQGLSLLEVAERIGRSEEAVKKLQARGLAALRRVMDCRSGCWRVGD